MPPFVAWATRFERLDVMLVGRWMWRLLFELFFAGLFAFHHAMDLVVLALSTLLSLV